MVRIKTLLKLVTYLCIATGYASVAPYVEPYYAVSFAVLAGLAVTLDFTKPPRIPRWVLNCVSVGVLAYSCSRINPDYLIEPILNSLVILIAIKSLEDKKLRDYMQIYAICMFLQHRLQPHLFQYDFHRLFLSALCAFNTFTHAPCVFFS